MKGSRAHENSKVLLDFFDNLLSRRTLKKSLSSAKHAETGKLSSLIKQAKGKCAFEANLRLFISVGSSSVRSK